MSMLRTLVKAARPGLTCVSVRNIRAKPVYWHPADPDPDEEQRFNEEFGLAEPVEDTSMRSKNEDWCWIFDPLYKAKARFYHLFGGQLYYRQSAEEKADAALLTDRLQEFYSTIPQRYPDSQWWNDVIDHYVRYNDYDGAVRIWNWLKEYELDVDQTVLDKFERFFVENDPIGLMTKSIPAQLREQDEYIPQYPDLINDNLLRIGDWGIEPEA
ncbi:hypothetical protein ACHWQZ_G003628 [Mnemiopsis leidyi]